MLVYKICHPFEWTQAARQRTWEGSVLDQGDGFIHLSTARQVPATLAAFYADATDLILVAVDTELVGRGLRYETSGADALFPHLYAPLPLEAVKWAKPIARNRDGVFELPEDCV